MLRRDDDPARSGQSTSCCSRSRPTTTQAALDLLPPLDGRTTRSVLTLQNGVDSVDEVAQAVGEGHVLGGTTYVATALESPGVIVQTGVHRSIIFGEVFGGRGRITPRVQAIADVMAPADIIGDRRRRRPRADLGQVRLPRAVLRFHRRGPAADRPALAATRRCGTCSTPPRARSPRWPPPRASRSHRIASTACTEYMDNIPPTTRSSLLIDLEMGKRIEVEALQGAAVRRAAKHGCRDADHLDAVRRLEAHGLKASHAAETRKH